MDYVSHLYVKILRSTNSIVKQNYKLCVDQMIAVIYIEAIANHCYSMLLCRQIYLDRHLAYMSQIVSCQFTSFNGISPRL
jgi:hypothetical protein